MVIACALTAPVLLAASPDVLAGCTRSWSKSDYKSFGEIKKEVRRQLGNAQIIGVQLCGKGPGAYFHVVAIERKSGKSVRVELRIPAAK